MFSLEELKEIQKNYIYYSYERELVLRSRAKGDPSVKKPEDLSQDEKNKILSAIYLKGEIIEIFRYNEQINPKTEQQILDEIQSDYYKLVLTPGKKMITGLVLIGGRTVDNMLISLASPKEKVNHLPEIYLQYILAEHGKKATNIQRGIEGGGLAYTISYDIEDLEKNNFIKQMDPQNSIYTQPEKKIKLAPEELSNRKRIVERLINYYRKMELDEWYESRKLMEDTDMEQVANMVNKNEIIEASITGPKLFRMLIAAQNLSIDGEQDFVAEMLKQPAVDKAIIELKKSGQAKIIRTHAEENEKQGKVNVDGLIEGHSLTHGERSIRDANKFVGEHPNAVLVEKNEMSKEKTLFIKRGDKEKMKKARLREVIARTQGISTTRITFSNGDRALDINNEKVQSK